MKAVVINRFGDPEELELREVPDPVPEPGEMLIQVAACGVNPIDTYICRGQRGDRTFPFVPGFDGAGIVEAVGSPELTHRIGERVYFGVARPGAYAEKVCVKTEHAATLPSSASWAAGAALWTPYHTAGLALFFEAQAKPGEWCLIHGGSGAVGIAAIQFAGSAGIPVVATVGSDHGEGIVRSQGVTQVVHHSRSGYEQELLDKTKGLGFPVILEMLANENLERDLDLIAHRGRIVIIGCRGTLPFSPRKIMNKRATVRGFLTHDASSLELKSIQERIAAGFAAETIAPVLRHQYRLADAATAHRAILAPGAAGKIVLTTSD